MRICWTFLLLLLISLVSSPAQTRLRSATEISTIDSYVSQIDHLTENKRTRYRLFADISSASETEQRWKEFKDEVELDTARTGDNLNEIASVWSSDGKIVGVHLTQTSPSGDWVLYAFYYFRPDGTLAKIDSQLNTFYGNVTVKRAKYFASTGKLLRSSTKFFDLESQKPRRAAKDFFDRPTPLFPHTKSLPFTKLL